MTTTQNVKKTTFVLMLVALLAISAFSASADLITTHSSLDATLLNYQPVPAHPGDLIDVWIQVQNTGGTASQPGTLTIVDSGPFTLESESQRVNAFPSVPAQGTFLAKVTVRIDKNANEGENGLVVQVREQGSTDYLQRTLNITIQGRTGALSILGAKTSPQILMPGGTGTLTLIVKNVGDTQLQNVQATLSLANASLAPLNGSNSQTISTLGGGQQYAFTFGLVSTPDATSQAYGIPVTLTYQDEQGNTLTQQEMVGVVVGSQPELLVYPEQVSITKDTMQGSVIIKFVNKGLSDLKLVSMQVLPSSDITVLSDSSILYVGTIATDDYQSADLSLKVAKDQVELPLNVTYRDALNREYTETVDVPLTVQDAANGSGMGWTTWIIIIVVIGAAAWFWIVRRKRHAADAKRR